MTYEVNHIHIKAPDAKKTADWYVKAFNFRIISDVQRDSGDRFIRCEATNGVLVFVSEARTGDQLGAGDATAHWGLEHLGVSVDDLDADLQRLKEMGAELMEGPTDVAGGARIAFLKGPDDVRIELVQPA